MQGKEKLTCNDIFNGIFYIIRVDWFIYLDHK